MSCSIYITVCKESTALTKACLIFALNNLHNIDNLFIIGHEHPNIKEFTFDPRIKILKFNSIFTPPAIPMFFRLQQSITHFLAQTTSDFFIKIDPDTIVLRSPNFNTPCAGQFLLYKKDHHIARYSAMPGDWQKQNQKILGKENLHAIHGGFICLNRDLTKKLPPFFYFPQKPFTNTEILKRFGKRENNNESFIIGEEHSLGWWLKQANIYINNNTEVDNKQKYYYTYRGEIPKIKSPKNLKVFHPIKTIAELNQLLQLVPKETIPIKDLQLMNIRWDLSQRIWTPNPDPVGTVTE